MYLCTKINFIIMNWTRNDSCLNTDALNFPNPQHCDLSLIGNVLVVVINVSCTRLRLLTSIFMLNLVLRVYHLISGLTFRDAACEVIHSTFPAGFYSSIMFLLLMSIRKYATMVHPHSGWKKRRCVRCALTVALCGWWASWQRCQSCCLSWHLLTQESVKSNKTEFLYFMHIENIDFVLSVYYIRIVWTIVKLPTNQRKKIPVSPSFWYLPSLFVGLLIT